MSKTDFYCQCVLQQKLGEGTLSLVTWVEEKFAVEGNRVCIKDDPAHPETEVWTITKVGMKRTAKWVADRQKAHERWRRVTDV